VSAAWIESVADLKVDAAAAQGELRAVAREYQVQLDK
jgi:hypothetical protein